MRSAKQIPSNDALSLMKLLNLMLMNDHQQNPFTISAIITSLIKVYIMYMYV